MKMTLRIGLMILVAGGLTASSLSVIAAEQLDSWKVRGLSRPGTWFATNRPEKPVTIGLSKSSQGVGKQNSTKSKAGKERAQQVGSPRKGS